MPCRRLLSLTFYLMLLALALSGCQPGSPLMAAISTPTPVPVDRPIPPPWQPTPPPAPQAGTAASADFTDTSASDSDGPPLSLFETENILLLGTDRRPNWTDWRTDTIMVVGIDRTHNRAAVLSIPRDLYVEIPGIGQRRINQADYFGEKVLKVEGGGPALASQVIQDTFGIPIHHWVRVEIQGFRSLINALGGVTVHLDCPFYEYIYDPEAQEWTIFELPAGDVDLDGDTAYLFVTLRLRSSDFSRAQRQRQLLWALRQKATAQNLIPRIPELWQALQGTFFTDLNLLEILGLAQWAINLPPENIHAAGLDAHVERFIASSGADVLRLKDPAAVQAFLRDMAHKAPVMAAAGRRDPATCPSRPNGIPQALLDLYAPTPTPVPTPQD